jgi:hypothetical protein
MNLIGKFYVHYMCETYRTGKVEGEILPGLLLVRNDWMVVRDGEDVPPSPTSLLDIRGLAACCSPNEYFIEFFETRKSLNEYVVWMDKPRYPKPATVTKIH